MIADEKTLSRLMAASQRGDKRAYATLLEEASRWLTRYFRRKIAPEHLDDLVQEVLVSLHRKRASYDPARPFLPWLAAIARYRWVDHLRSAYRRQEQALEHEDPGEEGGQEAVLARMSLDRLLENLPIGQAEVIELVRIEGHSIAEAAALSGQSESLVKVNIHRGLKKLSALIEKAE
ncbi:MAG: sigma-70 family RNA polymerase sigma factor [Sphingomonadaceae bacterium]|nr:sigma-70 family RNA polymerase sigma factor [Sphingomonadaceae bacterium]